MDKCTVFVCTHSTTQGVFANSGMDVFTISSTLTTVPGHPKAAVLDATFRVIKLTLLTPEANSREPVSWSSEEISVSRGNFLGKMQSVREARVVRSTGSELREGWSRRMWGGRREEGGGRREEGGGRREEGGGRSEDLT